MLWIKIKNIKISLIILRFKPRNGQKKYRQQYLPVTVAGDDDTLLSNNRTRARGGSRFFGDFLFLGDLDQQNMLGTACFSRTRFPVKVVLKSVSLKCTEHTLVLFVICGWTRS